MTGENAHYSIGKYVAFSKQAENDNSAKNKLKTHTQNLTHQFLLHNTKSDHANPCLKPMALHFATTATKTCGGGSRALT